MKNLIFLLFLTLFYQPENCTQKINRDFNKQIERFFLLVSTEKFEEAIDTLYSYNPYSESKQNDIIQLRNNFAGLKNFSGKYLGKELLNEEFVGSRYVRLDYIVYFEKIPCHFSFEFYLPKETWIPLSFGGDDKISDLAGEKAKSSFMKKK